MGQGRGNDCIGGHQPARPRVPLSDTHCAAAGVRPMRWWQPWASSAPVVKSGGEQRYRVRGMVLATDAGLPTGMRRGRGQWNLWPAGGRDGAGSQFLEEQSGPPVGAQGGRYWEGRAGTESHLVGAAQLPGRRAVGNGSEARSCRISVHVWDGTSLLHHGHTARWLPRDTSGYALRMPRPGSIHRAVRMWVMACTLC